VGSVIWKVMGTGGAVLAGLLARKATTAGWKLATGNVPPTNPEDPDVDWKEALGFAAATGVAVGLARLIVTRKAADYYTKSAGHPPKALQEEASEARKSK
jgi:hypothetical protein